MPLSSPTVAYNQSAKLVPLYDSEDAIAVPINLPPGVTIQAGTVLGQITSAANDVQTITAPGSGTYVLSGTNPITGLTFTTTALAFGANDAAVLAALVAAGLTGTGLAVASLAVTFGGAYGGRPWPLMTATAGSVAHTTTGRSAKTMAAYASGNSDGTQAPKGLLEHTVTTDSSGNVTPTTPAFAAGTPYATMFVCGKFDLADLIGLDANAVTKLAGNVFAGAVGGTGSFKF